MNSLRIKKEKKKDVTGSNFSISVRNESESANETDRDAEQFQKSPRTLHGMIIE